MNKQELEVLLVELDEALVKAFPGPEQMSVLVVGGACLLFEGVVSRATQDIDVIIFDFLGSEEETTLIYDTPLANKVRKLIKAVGKRHGLKRNEQLFLNDDCSPFLLELSQNELPPMRLLRAYQKLLLYVPADLSYILACKLMAARPAKDFDDIKALCGRLNVGSRAQAQQIVTHYFPSPVDQAVHSLPQTLTELFDV
jgi:hypothetical protein